MSASSPKSDFSGSDRFFANVVKAARFSFAVAAFAITAGFAAPPCHARLGRSKNEGPVITMTDQVPNFSLPSQNKQTSRQNQNSASSVARTVLIFAAKRVVPAAGAVAIAVWVFNRIVRRTQEKQLRDFKSQLESFSSMLDLDVSKLDNGIEVDDKNKTDRSRTTIDDATRRSQRFNFETQDQNTESEQIAAKVRLDLFQGAKSEKDTAVKATAAGTGSDNLRVDSSVEANDEILAGQKIAQAKDDAMSSNDVVTPQSPYEQVMSMALGAIENLGMKPSDLAPRLEEARQKESMSLDDAKLAFNKYMSRVVSAHIDRALCTLARDSSQGSPTGTPEEAAEGMKLLNRLAQTMSVVAELAKFCGLVTGLVYVGSLVTTDRIREDFYRSYAVFCLSDESRVKDNSAMQSLLDMQMLLSVSDARAEAVNKEIAKGMFQVAVSSAMADGNLNAESKDALEQLKSAFGELLEGNSADNIISEVSVMRAMYSLQQLLQEQGVSKDDVQELRKMCADLGVDVDEMLRNADAMGDALGPEAKQFVGGLRALLKNDSSNVPDDVRNATASAALDAASKESEPTNARDNLQNSSNNGRENGGQTS